MKWTNNNGQWTKAIPTSERLVRQAIRLENTLFLRWLECKGKCGKDQYGMRVYIAKLARVRQRAFARVFRRQIDSYV